MLDCAFGGAERGGATGGKLGAAEIAAQADEITDAVNQYLALCKSVHNKAYSIERAAWSADEVREIAAHGRKPNDVLLAQFNNER